MYRRLGCRPLPLRCPSADIHHALLSLGPGWKEKREFNVKGKGRRVKRQTPRIVATFAQPRHLAHQTQQSTRKGRRQGEIARAPTSLIHENSARNREYANGKGREGR